MIGGVAGTDASCDMYGAVYCSIPEGEVQGCVTTSGFILVVESWCDETIIEDESGGLSVCQSEFGESGSEVAGTGRTMPPAATRPCLTSPICLR